MYDFLEKILVEIIIVGLGAILGFLIKTYMWRTKVDTRLSSLDEFKKRFYEEIHPNLVVKIDFEKATSRLEEDLDDFKKELAEIIQSIADANMDFRLSYEKEKGQLRLEIEKEYASFETLEAMLNKISEKYDREIEIIKGA